MKQKADQVLASLQSGQSGWHFEDFRNDTEGHWCLDSPDMQNPLDASNGNNSDQAVVKRFGRVYKLPTNYLAVLQSAGYLNNFTVGSGCLHFYFSKKSGIGGSK